MALLSAFTAATARPAISTLLFGLDDQYSAPASRSILFWYFMETVRDAMTVKSMALSSPASITPARGDQYIVNPTGAVGWVGQDNAIAVYDGSAWQFSAPSEGWVVYDQNNNKLQRYDGSAWGDFPASMLGIADAGSYFTGTEIETALQEVGAKQATHNGANLATGAGAGIDGIAAISEAVVFQDGDVYTTRFLIDLTGLNCGGTAGDIIGDDGTGAAYLGQITSAESGTIFGGRMTCLEAPGTGDADIDLYSATEATGVEDTAITALTETQIVNGGTWSIGTVGIFAAQPTAGEYLYLVGQGTGDTTYTAGKFIIELWGV